MRKKVDKSVVTPPVQSKIERILKPRVCGLTDKNKPVALVVTSPYYDDDSSTNLAGVASFLDDKGYGSINKSKKKKCTWHTDESEFDDLIKDVDMKGQPLTIWIEAHGALGWFFGPSKDVEEEFLGMMEFVAFMEKVVKKTKASIATVVLNGCFTANEFFNEGSAEFNCSPARMLSLLMPGTQVMGFIGKNASAAINDVYELTKEGIYKKISVKPEEASVVYQNGAVAESYKRALFCNHHYTHDFMAKLLGADEHTRDEGAFYQPCDALKHLKSSYRECAGYGSKQLAWAKDPTSITVEEVTDEAGPTLAFS